MNRVILEVRVDGLDPVFFNVYTETAPVPVRELLFTVFAGGKLARMQAVRWIPAQDAFETILKARAADPGELDQFSEALEEEGWVRMEAFELD